MKGTVLVGQRGGYCLEEKLGEGSYGVVYRAIAPSRDVVAIKALLDDENRDAKDRLREEIIIVSQLNHDNIIRVLDWGVGPNSMYWFAMPLMEAGSLDKIIEKSLKKFTILNVIFLLRGIADGLALYHSHGGIHRDIKPENILIARDGTPKLGDFGVARCPKLTKGNMTCSALGTPNYMAPEVLQNNACSQSDIYSLGVVFWELLYWKRHESPFVAPKIEHQFRPEIVEIYRSMTHLNFEKRPTAAMLVQRFDLLIAALRAAPEVLTNSAPVPVSRAMPAGMAARQQLGGSGLDLLGAGEIRSSDAAIQQRSSSPWGWLLGAAVTAGSLFLLGTSNDYDRKTQRYRGSDGKFRRGRWG